MNKTGKVWLVGAGPSDPGLFTLKGAQVLEQADVVVYDALVGQSILTKIPRQAKLINVGKRKDNHLKSQEEINQILVLEAQKGQQVVRLKGGDPFLFGRGGEELELLQKKHIPYEVVPGVTSALAVPAYHGIPLTHRDYCSSLHLITGHKKKDHSYDIDFEALVRTGGTLVFLMGAAALKDICQGLLEHGMASDMPAAILQKGTTAAQKRIVATVDSLTAEAARQGIETPAIIVVGQVCALAEQFSWYETLPLAGRKIVVTRPRQLISSMAAKLREKGAEVLELPAIRTEAIEPNQALWQCLDQISEYEWIIFTSPTGVRVFFEQMKKKKKDVRILAFTKLAAIGSATAKALQERGLLADLVPPVYDGESLGKAMQEVCSGNEKILIPRASEGNAALIEELDKIPNVNIQDIATYQTVYESSPVIDEKEEFEQDKIDYAVFTSTSTVRGFAKAAAGIDFTRVKAVCIGKQTQQAAESYGMQTFVARQATMDSMIDIICEIQNNQ